MQCRGSLHHLGLGQEEKELLVPHRIRDLPVRFDRSRVANLGSTLVSRGENLHLLDNNPINRLVILAEVPLYLDDGEVDELVAVDCGVERGVG